MDRESAKSIIKSIRRMEPEINQMFATVEALDDGFEHKHDFIRVIKQMIADLHVDIELKVFDAYPDLVDARGRGDEIWDGD